MLQTSHHVPDYTPPHAAMPTAAPATDEVMYRAPTLSLQYHRRPAGQCSSPIDSWKHGKLRVGSNGGRDGPALRLPSGRPTHPDSALHGGKGGQQRVTRSPDIPT